MAKNLDLGGQNGDFGENPQNMGALASENWLDPKVRAKIDENLLKKC